MDKELSELTREAIKDLLASNDEAIRLKAVTLAMEWLGPLAGAISFKPPPADSGTAA